MATKLRLTVFTVSCCNPQFAMYDKQYVERIREAQKSIGIEVDLDVVTATEAMMSMKYLFIGEIQPMFKKYGSAVAPALFINEKLALFGGVPTVDKLIEVLTNASQMKVEDDGELKMF